MAPLVVRETSTRYIILDFKLLTLSFLEIKEILNHFIVIIIT